MIYYKDYRLHSERIAVESPLERVGTTISGGDERIYTNTMKETLSQYKRII